MVLPTFFTYTTGPATLPDVGTLYYNKCLFSPLFETSVSGRFVKDNANRTVKYTEYSITADGYVTLPDGAESVAGAMSALRETLSAQGGELIYRGRGCDIVVGGAGAGKAGAAGVSDVAWGPVPELLEFQPLGGGRSAKVKWTCKTCVRDGSQGTARTSFGIPLLQFNYETVVSYGEDGYSSLSVRGTMEIPLTRTPSITTRTLTTTVDDLRSILDARVFAGIDLSRFRVTRREYNISRDKRTLEFDVACEEKPYMDLPLYCTVARGTFNVRPSKSGAGLCNWLCTLRATYTVRADAPRRTAWFLFLALLRHRMAYSVYAPTIDIKTGAALGPGVRGILRGAGAALVTTAIVAATGGAGIAVVPTLLPHLALSGSSASAASRAVKASRKAWLIDFSFDEGLYLDSKTVSFSATWRVVTPFSHILLASGLWRKLPEKDARGNNLWAASMRDVSGSQSWLPNKLDPLLDVIVDFGS